MRDREAPRGHGNGHPTAKTIVYCVVPYDLAHKLHDPLRRHFRDDPGIEVIVEQRGRERRAAADRRKSKDGPSATERRRIHNADGRRVGEQRAPAMPVEAPELPRKARGHAERLLFYERAAPSSERTEDLDTARLITRFQAGDPDVFGVLYSRYFDRIYGYLRAALNDPHGAEDLTQDVFMKVLEALPDYERRAQPFRAWLFVIVRNHALNQLQSLRRVDVESPADISDRAGAEEEPADLAALAWVSDPDLMQFIERLPPAQQQVLMLRYMLDLPHRSIAAILHRENADVRVLHHRALRFLEQRLAALGRDPGSHQQVRWQRRPRHANVLRSRRFALLP